jgi:hypothetical protein
LHFLTCDFRLTTLDLELSSITCCPDQADACQEKYDPDDAYYSKCCVTTAVINYPDARKYEANYTENGKYCAESAF